MRLLALLIAGLMNTWEAFTGLFSVRKMRDFANVNLGGLITVVFAIVGVILAAVLGLKIIAALAPTYAASVSDIADVFNTTDWGDQTATDISPIFAMVVGIAGLLGLVGLVFLSLNVYRSRRS